MSGPALLVDVRNSLYKAIHASKSDNTKQHLKHHYFAILLRQMTSWMNKLRPSSVHIFWDAPRKEVWRKAVLPTYKNRVHNPKSSYPDITEELLSTTAIATEFFKHMNVRQYLRKQMEADDMIYAATTVMHPQPTIIVSTDSDMVQIPYNFNSSKIFNPTKKKITPVPIEDPVWQKALAGDTSDHIDGYRGIGPKKSAILLEDHANLRNFLDNNDAKIFYRNLLLIDLSLCPRLLKNKIYVQKRLSEPVSYCSKTINELIMKHKVNGLMQEFSDLIVPFSRLQKDK